MKPPKAWKVVGFTSERSAHAHLLKHVLRTSEADPSLPKDPEAWEELLTASSLPGELALRRERALARLRCARGCQDGAAQLSVSREMGDVMGEYLAVATGSLEHARMNPDRRGPRRLTYYRDKERSLRSHPLEPSRARAKHRRAGTLVEVQ